MATKTANKILVVDDDSDILDFLIDLLQEEVSVSFSSEGAKALDLVKRHKPDLILLDVMMPDMNGFDVCRQLKADPETQHVPVIFLTSKADEKDIVEGLGLGAIDYITKPFDPEIVATKVRNFLSQISATRASATPDPRTAPDQRAKPAADQSRDRRAEGGRRADRNAKTTPTDANGPVIERRSMGVRRPDRFDKPVAPAKTMPLSRVLLVALFLAIAAGGGYAWYSNVDVKVVVAKGPASSATASKTTGSTQLNGQPDLSGSYEQQKSGQADAMNGPQPLTSQPSTESCEKIPEVPWWGNANHASIIAYVNNKNNGDWTAYINKWERQLAKLKSVHAKSGAVIAPKVGTRLKGPVLAEYITQVETRLSATRCIASKFTNR